jgi:hypothetical protein
MPALVGRVIDPDRRRLAGGCTCSINGRDFVRSPEAAVQPGDSIIIMSADAGG